MIMTQLENEKTTGRDLGHHPLALPAGTPKDQVVVVRRAESRSSGTTTFPAWNGPTRELPLYQRGQAAIPDPSVRLTNVRPIRTRRGPRTGPWDWPVWYFIALRAAPMILAFLAAVVIVTSN